MQGFIAMFIYDDLAVVATDLFTEFNQGIITLTQNVEGVRSNSYTPGTLTPTSFELHGTVTGVESKFVDGKLIVTSDLQIRCASTATNKTTNSEVSVIPSIEDKISVDGVAHELLMVKKIPAAGVTVAYLIFVRS